MIKHFGNQATFELEQVLSINVLQNETKLCCRAAFGPIHDATAYNVHIAWSEVLHRRQEVFQQVCYIVQGQKLENLKQPGSKRFKRQKQSKTSVPGGPSVPLGKDERLRRSKKPSEYSEYQTGNVGLV